MSFLRVRTPFLRCILLLSGALACVSALPAESAEPGGAGGQEEIEPVRTSVTVTATRSPLEIDETPVSTSLVTREEMEDRNIRQIDQALLLLEGVNAARAKGPADNDFGLGLRGFSGRGGQYRTLVLVDGQPMNTSYYGGVNWSTFGVSEFERVEVARGPFSSLYGGNAMGGVINLITRPIDRSRLELSGQYGSQDTTQYSLHGGKRFFDKLGLSAGYSRYQTGGYSAEAILRGAATGAGAGTPVTGVTPWLTPANGSTYQVGDQGRNWFTQQAFRVRAEHTFSERLFASVQYMRQERQSGYDAYGTSLRAADGTPVDTGRVSFVQGGAARELTVAPSNYIGLPTGADVNIYQAHVLANLSPAWNLNIYAGVHDLPNDWYVLPGADANLSHGSGSYTNTFSRGLYGNVQAGYTRGADSFIAGAETRHDSARTGNRNLDNYALRQSFGPVLTQAFGKAINQSAYAQYQRSVRENLNIVAGGRWDYWRTYEGGNQTGLGEALNFYPNRSTNAFTGKVAALYTLPGNWQARASIGNAFRNPTVYELYRDLVLSSSLLLANPDVRPEKLLAYEAGLSRRFLGRNSFGATFFQNRLTDMIYRVTDFAFDPTGRTRRLTNAGRGRIRGVEAAAEQEPLAWLRLRQSYTYTGAVIAENDPLPATVGQRIPWTPAHTASYLAVMSRKKWTLAWSGRYVSKLYSSDTNTDVTRGVPRGYDPFFEMDGTLTFDLDRRASLFIDATNILDRDYFQYYRARGRTVSAGVRLRVF
jgi:iron complex outermembrane receptor protein